MMGLWPEIIMLSLVAAVAALWLLFLLAMHLRDIAEWRRYGGGGGLDFTFWGTWVMLVVPAAAGGLAVWRVIELRGMG